VICAKDFYNGINSRLNNKLRRDLDNYLV
jgi:hypothetical protein